MLERRSLPGFFPYITDAEYRRLPLQIFPLPKKVPLKKKLCFFFIIIMIIKENSFVWLIKCQYIPLKSSCGIIFLLLCFEPLYT